MGGCETVTMAMLLSLVLVVVVVMGVTVILLKFTNKNCYTNEARDTHTPTPSAHNLPNVTASTRSAMQYGLLPSRLPPPSLL